MSGPVADRVVDYLARREEDDAGAAGWAELDPTVAREVAACARMERELSALSLTVRGHPDRAGPFVLLRPLGEGSAGPVYLAERGDDAVRAAVRLLKGPAAEPALAAARAFVGWRHDAAVAVLDAGEGWVATELTAGVSLARVLAASRKDPPGDQGEFARPLLKALASVGRALLGAHGERRIHGGVCPRRIDLGRDGALRVRDFGFPSGSPLFLAPEQAGGDREPSAATDVFSLASVAFEVASGVPPVSGRSASAALAAIRTAPRSLGPLTPWAPPDLVGALDAARALAPAERLGLGDLVDALDLA